MSTALPARISVSSPRSRRANVTLLAAASTGSLLPACRCAEMAAQPLEEMADSFFLALSAFPPSFPFLSSLPSSLPLLVPTRLCGEGSRLPCCGWLYLELFHLLTAAHK